MADTPPLPLLYRDVVPLSRDAHKGWHIDTSGGYGFAATTNSVFVAASEFALAGLEYPIVFARDESTRVVPAALLGFERDRNLMVDESGQWSGDYVPAYVRRYPFILAEVDREKDEFTVCIDRSFSGFNTGGEGEPLITESGERGEILGKSVQFLRDFHQHTVATLTFCGELEDAGLLDAMEAKVTLQNGMRFALSGFLCVRRDRLKALPTESVQRYFENGYLELVYQHLHSLANVNRLVRIANARIAEGRPG